LDLGCGSGEGFELLTSIRRRTSGVETTDSMLVTEDLIERYLGVDISQAMVDQGRASYAGNEKIAFEQADLRAGLPKHIGEEPFDLYFSSYGSFSHLNDTEFEQLLVDICSHSGERALIFFDLLGRYSYEWQSRWGELPESGMSEYSMAYLPTNGAAGGKVEQFPMRYWSRPGLMTLLDRVRERVGKKVALRKSYDRSILVGRHMDTGLYNTNAPSMRRVVNMLHESNLRTDLRELLFDYTPKPGFDEANRFFTRLQMAWNRVVSHCMDLLSSDQMDPEHEDLDAFPEPVRGAMKTMARVIDNVRWMRMGDPRANIIEPQLAYALRSLERGLQEGMGYGHGFIGVIEVTD